MKVMAIESEFTMQELRDLREVFQVYDPSNTGSLTISDLRKVEMHAFKHINCTILNLKLGELYIYIDTFCLTFIGFKSIGF